MPFLCDASFRRRDADGGGRDDRASKEPRSGFRKKAAIVVFDAGIPSGARIVRRSAERRYAFTAGVQTISNMLVVPWHNEPHLVVGVS